MGKGGKSNNVSEETVKNEVLIEGRYYDVTGFKHPGGSIIQYYSGKEIDASEAFTNFHIRSKKAKKILEKIPSRKADQQVIDKNYLEGQKNLIEEFHVFQDELLKEGLFEPAPLHVAYRVCEICVMFGLGIYLLFNSQITLGLIITGITTGRCGWLMHEGGHYSLTGNILWDRSLQIVLYGVGCGMSGSWWRNQHNKHHATPQKLGHDVDLNTLPLVCFTEKVAKRIGLPLKLWIRLQAVMFPIITTLLVSLGWQFYLHPRHILRTKNLAEGVSLISRYTIIAVLFGPQFGFWNVVLGYLACTWIGGNYIFLNFAVSHTHLPVVDKDDTKTDWVRYSAVYTMNVHPGPLNWVNWWMSYLNFQIEHHLFPSMPQFRHPLISTRVKAFFEKHGLKYQQRSYVDSMAVTFRNLHKVSNEVFLG